MNRSEWKSVKVTQNERNQHYYQQKSNAHSKWANNEKWFFIRFRRLIFVESKLIKTHENYSEWDEAGGNEKSNKYKSTKTETAEKNKAKRF